MLKPIETWLEVKTGQGVYRVPTKVVNEPTYINLPPGVITAEHPEFASLCVRVEAHVRGEPISIEAKQGEMT